MDRDQSVPIKTVWSGSTLFKQGASRAFKQTCVVIGAENFAPSNHNTKRDICTSCSALKYTQESHNHVRHLYDDQDGFYFYF